MVLVIGNDTLINRFRKVVNDGVVLMAQSPNDTCMNHFKTLWTHFYGWSFDVEDKDVLLAKRILADVEETKAILTGYWEGVSKETGRELAEQRREAVPVVAGEGQSAPVMKKGKAAKRKQ